MTRIFFKSAVLLLLVMGWSFAAQAGEGESFHKGPDSSKNPVNGMNLQGEMFILGNDVQNGVKAMAHLKEVEKAMAELGGNVTHHLMVVFVDQDTGELIDSGSAAVKYRYQNKELAGPIPLTAMQGHFGADLALLGPGNYHFLIGSEFADGRKRQFRFDFTLQ